MMKINNVILVITLLLLCHQVITAQPNNAFKKIKLSKSYSSKREYLASKQESHKKGGYITGDKQKIKFIDASIGRSIMEIQKVEVKFTDDEFNKLTDQDNISPIVKKDVDYYISANNQYLIKSEFEWELYNKYETHPTKNIFKRSIYNSKGEVIGELPKEVNSIISSPTNNGFVGYYQYDGSSAANNIYFFNNKGVSLDSFKVGGYPQINYSYNGNCIAVYNLVKDVFYIFGKNGNLLFQGDSKNYVHRDWVLYNVEVSDDGQYVMLNTTAKAFLLDIEGNIVWEKPSDRVLDAYINTSKNLVILYAANENKKPGTKSIFKLETLSLKEGTLHDRLEQLGEFEIKNAKYFSIQQEGKYYEYEIK